MSKSTCNVPNNQGSHERNGHAEAINSPVLVTLDEVESKRVRWLWENRIAIGKLNLIVGNPGLGKSLLTLDMAARVTRGFSFPDQSSDAITPAGSVVLLTAEDDLGDTIRPRLEAAGARLDRVAALTAVKCWSPATKKGIDRPVSLENDLPALKDAIERVQNCRLVIIDPLDAYLGAINSHKSADVRGLLAPLAELAAYHDVAIVLVQHLNKSISGPAIYRAMGSLAFVAAARSAWLVAADPENQSRRLVLPVKNNLAPDSTGLAYSIAVQDDAPCLAWENAAVNMTADEALATDNRENKPARQAAKAFLREVLATDRLPQETVQSLAKEHGHAWRTVLRAKNELGVQSKKDSFTGHWFWSLPDEECTTKTADFACC